MRPLKLIELSEPVEYHGKMIAKVALRSPNGADAMSEPRIWVRNADGAMYPVENATVLRELVDRLLVGETGVLPDGGLPELSSFSLADGMAIKDAVLDFFTEAEQRKFSRRLSGSLSSSARSDGEKLSA